MKHLLLLLVFFQLTFAALACERYDRKSYRHWVDEDRDCQNARHEVLLEESQGGVSFKTSLQNKVKVDAGGSASDSKQLIVFTSCAKVGRLQSIRIGNHPTEYSDATHCL